MASSRTRTEAVAARGKPSTGTSSAALSRPPCQSPDSAQAIMRSTVSASMPCSSAPATHVP